MRKQIIPDAVEFLDFHMEHRQRCAALEALICNGDYIPAPILRMKVEKGKGLCRQIALPSPAEALVLQALSDSLWREIKNKAPSPTAFFAPQDQPFSKLNPMNDEDEFGYGPIESWLDFQQEVLKFSQTRNFVVVTDIANYYDGILHSFLRAILSDYGLEREYALDLLLFILEAMLWRPDYMPNFGIGLPQMDLDAPRLLAHTHLFEVDELFEKDPDVDFARYMDDMDFGVDTLAKAKSVLRDLDLALHTRNIRLNSGKTTIMTGAEAVKYFRVAENMAILSLTDKMSKCSSDRRVAIYRRLIARSIKYGIEKRLFDQGSGGKILKRLLGIVFRNNIAIDDTSFRNIIYDRPALRDYLLRGWIRSPEYKSQMNIVTGFLGSGQAVDDYSKIAIATSIASAIHTYSLPSTVLYELVFHLKGNDPFNLHARLILTSRLDTPSRLLSEITKTQGIWSRYSFLSRLVASFYGLFIHTVLFDDFDALVKRHGGSEGMSVYDFHHSIANDAIGFRSAKPFIDAGNPSLPVGISHAKVMMLATAMWNKGIPKIERAQMLATHAKAMTDTYYRQMLSTIISMAP
ncbi:RNA-directed DNA polymerase [Sphingomonas sp. DC1600-2]|uniref:RNA-directed DNA polymerase n=1 Tax=unclassified Sphingomonas TaxID=196159 RepID=UPI003CF5BB23